MDSLVDRVRIKAWLGLLTQSILSFDSLLRFCIPHISREFIAKRIGIVVFTVPEHLQGGLVSLIEEEKEV